MDAGTFGPSVAYPDYRYVLYELDAHPDLALASDSYNRARAGIANYTFGDAASSEYGDDDVLVFVAQSHNIGHRAFAAPYAFVGVLNDFHFTVAVLDAAGEENQNRSPGLPGI
jgi:hypothetical protein